MFNRLNLAAMPTSLGIFNFALLLLGYFDVAFVTIITVKFVPWNGFQCLITV